MSVTIRKTAGHAAEITWSPKDDPHGYLAHAMESDRLAYALESLGGGETETTPELALQATRHTSALARELERRAAAQVVALRDKHGLSWRQIASVVLEDPERQSGVRRMYESGRRHLGL
ncbi:hypothetical protein [Streptomyces sp. NPDC002215]|uniref:hypothetical protein n=1 Tax=Streptomyces sp. NPDC002215 TaxID=3154412 RepID=UPI0033306D9A